MLGFALPPEGGGHTPSMDQTDLGAHDFVVAVRFDHLGGQETQRTW